MGRPTPFKLSSGTVNVADEICCHREPRLLQLPIAATRPMQAVYPRRLALAGTVAGTNFASKTAMNFVTFNTNTNPPTARTDKPAAGQSPMARRTFWPPL